MAWVNTKESWSRTNSSQERLDGIIAARATAAKAYTVLYDNADNLNGVAAYSASGVPALGAAFDASTTWLTCQRKRVLNPLGPCLYEVLCEYGGRDSPLLEPAAKAWAGSEVVEAAADDADGNPYLTPAGKPFENMTRTFYDRIYRFARNAAADTFSSSGAWRGTVNSAAVTLNGHSCAAKTCLMKEIQADRIVDGTNYYWRETFTILIRSRIVSSVELGWQRRMLNEGRQFLWTAGVPADLGDAMTSYNVPTVMLAANGTKLAAGGTPTFSLFQDYKALDWSTLNLY